MTPSKKALVLFVERRGQRTDVKMRLQEDVALSENAGLEVVEHALCVLRRHPSSATFLGKGWVEKIHEKVTEHGLQYVVIDPEISPIQQRNLERAWGCTVMTRTAIILEIFGQRARTAAGVLQVQLAKLLYQKGRLVGSWTHLERQRGGFGFLGGPGESQLELDRRVLRDHIAQVEEKLEKVVRTRELHRKARQKVPYAVVALVGYTNVGKSTLFNQLSGANVDVQDRPFETLDPTMRTLRLPSGRHIILADTVGFISGLPKSLRLAFEATLEEVKQADLLLHVRDSAALDAQAQNKDVLDVLEAMGCTVPLLEVFNKVDLAPEYLVPQGAVGVSALKQEGFGRLLSAIDDFLDKETICVSMEERPSDGAFLSFLHEHGRVISVGDGQVTARLSTMALGRLKGRFPDLVYTVCPEAKI